METPDILVVADDLTSAADGVAPFGARGLPAQIRLGTAALSSVDAQVVGIDIGTRRMAPGPASDAVKEAMTSSSATTIVKTIDSALRGNVATEIAAAQEATGRPLTIVAPAFPAEGRTTVGGVQQVNGIPVALTAFGSDRTHPVRESRLSQLLAGSYSAPDDLDTATGIVIADASTDQDLDDLVARVHDFSRVLWVGSPGLCSALARRNAASLPDGQMQGGPVLVVVGSEHPASAAQLTHVNAIATAIDLAGVPVSAARGAVLEGLRAGGIVTLTDTSSEQSADQVRNRISSVAGVSSRVTGRVGLIATGGDTARSVLDACGITALTVRSEPAPGVVAGTDTADPRRTVVIKAGSFGGPNLLKDLARGLHAGSW
ncbi:four-carbon acid sugar kinase family protein [Tsukamurella ocularis]|uniref:four-carbon acid sugar kinase family protein n=1 Tax=Tsukamurella ocularis TaxID=1970234 RepID=UPI0021688415|nr:four-carbon acid sugar kinase family protein [Tsukamurella ocularis]MCS3779469.1 uncharacterized protein YgbK (DUF1537 family) [Tsukamurella ocularis]MCS3788058.1 uncharacterized protein YgbK (DUF1537 family) [Tsukamurella ocularis]MCS3852374.1 uncharacterized protein YgbK (DUF1537 family) [Tsukamurella ocularis]